MVITDSREVRKINIPGEEEHARFYFFEDRPGDIPEGLMVFLVNLIQNKTPHHLGAVTDREDDDFQNFRRDFNVAHIESSIGMAYTRAKIEGNYNEPDYDWLSRDEPMFKNLGAVMAYEPPEPVVI